MGGKAQHIAGRVEKLTWNYKLTWNNLASVAEVFLIYGKMAEHMVAKLSFLTRWKDHFL